MNYELNRASPRTKESRCCCMPTDTAWKLTALAGAIILAVGIVFMVSLNTSSLGKVRAMLLNTAEGIGTSPFMIPILVSAVGGTVFLGGIFGHAHYKCSQSEAIA